MRDWGRLDRFYEELKKDVYKQPDEKGRIDISKRIIDAAPVQYEGLSILDVGCGEGYAQELFTACKKYIGITADPTEYEMGKLKGRNVMKMDFNFLVFQFRFDLIFSSHALEHSPFPLLTLMEWHDFADKLLIINPNPEHYGYIGKNHYSVMTAPQLRWLLRRAGWHVVWQDEDKTDLAYLCERRERIGSEGWANDPLPYEIYEMDRDNL